MSAVSYETMASSHHGALPFFYPNGRKHWTKTEKPVIRAIG
jgi:hypothetical protein